MYILINFLKAKIRIKRIFKKQIFAKLRLRKKLKKKKRRNLFKKKKARRRKRRLRKTYRRRFKARLFKRKIKAKKIRFSFLVKTKKTQYNDILFFIKYFSFMRRRDTRILSISRIKTHLHKRKKKKNKNSLYLLKKYLNFNKKSSTFNKVDYLTKLNFNLNFEHDEKYNAIPRVCELRRRYISYLNSNRALYRQFNFKTKQNLKFFKRHIPKISKLSLKGRTHLFECSLKNLIIKLKYAYSAACAKSFIRSGYIFINGRQSFNPNRFLYKGDYLEFIYTKILFKFFKKIKIKMQISMRKYKRQNWRFNKNKVIFENKYISLLKFSRRIFFYKSKVPRYIQYDLRTLTYILIEELNPKKDLTLFNKKIVPLYLIKLFTWKLIS